MTITMQEATRERERFFKTIFGPNAGYVCIGMIKNLGTKGERKLVEKYFHVPGEYGDLLAYIEQYEPGNNVYFCPQLLKQKIRNKESIGDCPAAWADLDLCNPNSMKVKPSIVIRTSSDRWQALWIFDKPVDPLEAEDISKRIAYEHADEGCDKSGWDLTQLLRVPFTHNYKRAEPFEVTVSYPSAGRYRKVEFDMYPPATGFEYVNLPFPTDLPESTAEETLREYDGKLVNKARTYYLFQTPLAKTADWSSALWGLEMLLFESGMSREEVFIVAEASVVNKYARDDRPRERLWMDVCKAFAKNESNSNIIIPVYDENKPILTEEEVAFVESHPGFVERYIEWASKMGDAAVQYHQAGAFVLLSTLLAGNVKLPTSFGTIKPNVWFMLLADTTLTRKSTAMDLAMDLITEVDPDAILATDGSIEGLITSLATRPSRPSIFLRDEFAGLLESMTKKEYMAGMSEQLTKLYDGKMMKRVLRKEQIEVKDPCLILFAGGIRTRICALLTFEQITSGFIPRFIFITAESDVSKLRPLGPPSIRSLGNRQEILDELKGLQQHYGVREIRVVASQVTEIKPNEIEASLTPDAWDRYNAAETGMVAAAAHHQMAEYLTPVYDRLAKTGLKTAILLAAARQRTSTVIVEMEDVIHALYYVEGWRTYVQQIINNVGKTTNERQLDLISMAITKKPGVSRSTLMQNYHLEARIAEQIFATLEQRGLITRERLGRGEVFHPIQVKVGV